MGVVLAVAIEQLDPFAARRPEAAEEGRRLAAPGNMVEHGQCMRVTGLCFGEFRAG